MGVVVPSMSSNTAFITDICEKINLLATLVEFGDAGAYFND